MTMMAKYEFAKQILSAEGWEILENKTGFHFRLKDSDVDLFRYHLFYDLVARVYEFALAYIDCYKRGLIKVSDELMDIINGIDC